MLAIEIPPVLRKHIFRRSGFAYLGGGDAPAATWRCKYGHQWTGDVGSIMEGPGCPDCKEACVASYAALAARVKDVTGGELKATPFPAGQIRGREMWQIACVECRAGHNNVVLLSSLRRAALAEPGMRSHCHECAYAASRRDAERLLSAHVQIHTGLYPPLADIAVGYLHPGQAILCGLTPRSLTRDISSALEWLSGEPPEAWAVCAPRVPKPRLYQISPAAIKIWGRAPADDLEAALGAAGGGFRRLDDGTRSHLDLFGEVEWVAGLRGRLGELMFHLWGAAGADTVAVLPGIGGATIGQYLGYRIWASARALLAEGFVGTAVCPAVHCARPCSWRRLAFQPVARSAAYSAAYSALLCLALGRLFGEVKEAAPPAGAAAGDRAPPAAGYCAHRDDIITASPILFHDAVAPWTTLPLEAKVQLNFEFFEWCKQHDFQPR